VVMGVWTGMPDGRLTRKLQVAEKVEGWVNE